MRNIFFSILYIQHEKKNLLPSLGSKTRCFSMLFYAYAIQNFFQKSIFLPLEKSPFFLNNGKILDNWNKNNVLWFHEFMNSLDDRLCSIGYALHTCTNELSLSQHTHTHAQKDTLIIHQKKNIFFLCFFPPTFFFARFFAHFI